MTTPLIEPGHADAARALQDPAVLRQKLIDCGRDRAQLQEKLAQRDRQINELKVQKAALERRIRTVNDAAPDLLLMVD